MCMLSVLDLHVTNYRKFSEATFRLNPHMNVFAGKNGSGKTSVLEAVNVILGAYLAAYKTYVPSRFVFNISKDDAHLKPQTSRDTEILTSGGVRQYPCKVSCTINWADEAAPIMFKRVLFKEDGRTKFDGPNPMVKQVVAWERLIAQANNSDIDVVLPIVLYLSSARLWNENKARFNESSVFSRTDAYNRCLDGKHGTELAFEYINMLQSVAAEERDGKAFPAYEAILSAINYALRDELHTGESVIFSTRYGKDIVALRLADGAVVPFASLSDGYRNVIKVVLDIATRMCILNPYLQGEALQKTPGIVIIDELDLSLHPIWQKRIISILKELFPKVQFICATHSPFVIQSLESGELIKLDDDDDNEYSGEYSEDYSSLSIEDIAEVQMGVSMPQYSTKKEEMYLAAKAYFEALDACKTAEEIELLRERLNILSAEYSDNPAYLALIRQEYTAKKTDVEKNETDR